MAKLNRVPCKGKLSDMRLKETDIDQIYERLILHDDPARVLEIAADLFGGHAGALIRADSYGLNVVGDVNLDKESMLNYHSDLASEDLLYHAALRLPIDRPFTAASETDLVAQEKTDYYKFVLAPSDIHDTISMRFARHDGMYGFSVYRPKGEFFQQEQLDLAAKIYPHLRRALYLYDKKGQASQQRAQRVAKEFQLTSKEEEIVYFFSGGQSNEEVAALVGVTQNTLKWHLKNIFRKLRVKSRSELLVKILSL